MSLNHRILLAEAPTAALRADNFVADSVAIPAPPRGSALCRTLMLSIDPAARAWMSQRTYRDQLEPGTVMAGYTLAEVVIDNESGLNVGDLVFGQVGWQEYGVVTPADVRVVERRFDTAVHMSVLGITGLTAYFGLYEVARPAPGATVVVSAAAGATGNVVGQLAAASGHRVVGITGSAEKGRLLKDELGFDAVVSHREPSLRAALRAACPDGVDVYFDNVGGAVLDAILPLMNIRGCVVCCGAITGYDATDAPSSPRGIPGLLVTRRLRMEGFLVHDFEASWAKAEQALAELVAAGSVVPLHTVFDGLDQAPQALIGLLDGANTGKWMVRVGHDN